MEKTRSACMEKKSTAHARKRKGALDCNPSGYHDCYPLDDHGKENKRRLTISIFALA